jgi:hypothetical protein
MSNSQQPSPLDAFRALNPDLDTQDQAILELSAAAYLKRNHVQVGDLAQMPDGGLRRFAHDSGEDIQVTSDGNSRFYLRLEGANLRVGLTRYSETEAPEQRSDSPKPVLVLSARPMAGLQRR